MCLIWTRIRPLLAAWGLLFMGALPALAEPVALTVRVGPHPDKTRFVLEFNEPVTFNVFTLSDPYRIVVELPEVEWRLPAEAGTKAAGLVTGFRYGTFQQGASRVVIDLKGPAQIKAAFLAAPEGDRQHRLVIDLEAGTVEQFAEEQKARQPTQQAARAPAPVPDAAKKKRDNRRVVALDAGHGGVDPGAISVSGTYEKHITLAMALEVKRQLEKDPHYRVVLTRDDDVFIRLRDRVGIAREAGADLFVSLHADSIGSRLVRGASVYTLSEQASDKEAEALAVKENKADVIAGIDLSDKSADVSNILIDLAQRESMNQAVRVASLLVDNMRTTG
ncbi:MAG: AMIN domain-containing protein, partial [Alphaproteobacteria bacterium]|nr:AMIN domain-containing protein [Alphaproteobacteria bacterium]